MLVYHTILVFPVNCVANVTLSSVKQVLAEVKRGFSAWYGLLHPHLSLETKEVLTILEGGDSSKVPDTDTLY